MVLALLAGTGRLPEQIIDHCQMSQRPLFVLGFYGQTSPDLLSNLPSSCPYAWAQLGAIGSILEKLRAHDVTEIVMAGTMRRPSWSELRLDWTGTRWLAKMGLKSFGDDGLLKAAIGLLEVEGFRVVSAADILGNLLAPRGILGHHKPSSIDEGDIAHAYHILSVTGPLDIGQAVVVQQQLVLAVEAIEGTAAMLARCRDLRREGDGGVLVKMAKPQQSRLADLPTIGVETVEQAHAVGLRGIAIEAGATQIIDQEATITRANELGLFLIGLSEQ